MFNLFFIATTSLPSNWRVSIFYNEDSSGGGPFSLYCPTGSYVTRVYGYADSLLNSIGFSCSDGSNVGSSVESSDFNYDNQCPGGYFSAISVIWGLYIGQVKTVCNGGSNDGQTLVAGKATSMTEGQLDSDSNSDEFSCLPGGYIVGARGRAELNVDSIQFRCVSFPIGWRVSPFYNVATDEGIPFSLYCPTGSYVTRVYGRNGALLDNIGFSCSDGSNVGSAGGSGGASFDNQCPGGYFSAISVVWGAYINQVDTVCNGGSNNGQSIFADDQNIGDAYSDSFVCPSGSFIVGAEGRSKAYINSIQFRCVGAYYLN